MKTNKVLIFVVLLFLVVALVLAGCKKSATSAPDMPAATATGTPKIVRDIEATQTASAAMIREPTSPVEESIATEEPAFTPESVGYIVPKNAVPLPDGETGAIKGFFYVLNKEGPYTAEYPYQSMILVALGNGKIESGSFSKFLNAGEDEGNIFADICATPKGCSAVVSEYSAANVGVTVIFAGYENPDDTLIGGFNNMFNASNCGGSGCKTIYIHNIKGKDLTFKKAISSNDVAKFLTPAKEPYVVVAFRYEGVPSGAVVIKDDAKNVIGHEYFLTDKDAYVSVPEGGGTMVYCGAKAVIDGVKCPAGTVMLFTGTKSDGSSPEDLNYVIHILTTDPSAIRIVMIYAGSFDDQMARFKVQYPDWDWPE